MTAGEMVLDNIIKAEDKKEEQRRAQNRERAAEMRHTATPARTGSTAATKLEGLGYRPITVEDFILDGKQLSANSTKALSAGYFFNGGESSKYMFATQVDAAKAYHSGNYSASLCCSSIMPRVRPAVVPLVRPPGGVPDKGHWPCHNV